MGVAWCDGQNRIRGGSVASMPFIGEVHKEILRVEWKFVNITVTFCNSHAQENHQE
jgi:hypothetical protein